MKTKEEKEYQKKWRENNREKIREQDRENYTKYRKKKLENARNYRLSNLEKVKEYQKEYAIKNAERLKVYKRDWKLKRKFNIGAKDYDLILQSQNGVCAICGSDNNGKTLVVDHDHKTGLIRGLLCDDCNLFLGFVDDDETLIQKAISYLLHR